MAVMKNKFLMLLLSAVIALGLWVYVITVDNPEWEQDFYNIPVVLEGETFLQEQHGLVITTEDIPDVRLKLQGSRSELINLRSSDITIKVDLTKIYDAGTHHMTYSISYPGSVANDAFTRKEQSPDTITITVEKYIKKDVNVNVIYEGTVLDPEKYLADTDNAVLDYSTVRVEGPQSVIDQIKEARITVPLTDRTESFSESYRVTLCDEAGQPVAADQVKVSITDVNVTLLIQQVKEIPLVLNVIDGGGATSENSKITIDPLTIKIAGSATALEGLDYLELGTVDLSEITGFYQQNYEILLPAGVTNLTGVTSAQVIIQFPELLKRDITVTNISALNVPENLEADLVTKQMVITVRGPRDLVLKMKASDIQVTVDLSSMQKGTYTVKALVTMSSPYTSVGTFGTYSVTVTLMDPLEVMDDTEGQIVNE